MKQDDLNIPTFLARSETEAEAEARRAKAVPKDNSKGLKVVTPPDPKISAAIAKDFAETKKKEKFDDVKKFVANGKAAQSAADAVLKTALDKRDAAVGKKIDKVVSKLKKAKAAKLPKKAGKIVEKAIKARDELAAKAKAAISATNGKTPPKPAKKSSKGRYDWAAAEEAAKKGKIPETPDFSANTHKCYRPRLDEIVKLVKAKNVKALKAMKDSDFRKDGSPLIMNRYRKIAITALEA